ncbi:MAG: hypothetical protein Q4F15_01600 [Bacillota bacterium]|nr:hypothetical protein [Bacillota bacterium]
MNKSYFKWQLKQWIPMFFILTAFLGAIFLFTALLQTPYAINAATTSDGVYYYPFYMSSTPGSMILSAIIPAIIATFSMPFFVYSYRYKKQSADTYLPLPLKRGTILRTRLIIGLLMLLASITVVYWLGIGIFAIRQATCSIPESNEYWTYSRHFLSYQYCIPFFFLMLVFVAGQYFINCFFVSLGNTQLSSIFTLIAGTFILGWGLMCVLGYIGQFEYQLAGTNVMLNNIDELMLTNGGPTFPCYICYRLFDSLISKGTASSALDGWQIAYLIVYPIEAIGAGVYCFLKTEPSGEYFGTKGSQNIWISLLIHAYFLCASYAFLLTGTNGLSVVIFGMTFILEGVFYYGVLALYNGSFRLPKKDFIPYCSVMGFFLLSDIIFVIITSI